MRIMTRITGRLLYGRVASNAGPRGCPWVQGILVSLPLPIHPKSCS